VDETLMKIGLLMETAQAQQKLAESGLKKLKGQIGELGELVRAEVHRTLVAELHSVATDSRHAAEALRRLRASATLRLGLWSLSVIAACTAVALLVAWWVLPTPASIQALRARRDAYAQAVARLDQSGGRMELHRCGDGNRLCVRVDRQAPAYGESAEFMVVKGY